jgi:hypothetical protein
MPGHCCTGDRPFGRAGTKRASQYMKGPTTTGSIGLIYENVPCTFLIHRIGATHVLSPMRTYSLVLLGHEVSVAGRAIPQSTERSCKILVRTTKCN